MNKTKYVINSTDFNLTYCFFAPIVALLWRDRIGYSPITLLYDREAVWSNSDIYRLVLESTKNFSDIVHLAPSSQIRASTLTQVSRLYVSALDLPDSSYLLTSDVDMLPLSREKFHIQNPEKRFHIFGADAYRPEFKFPICYLGGSLEVWREIMGIETLDLNRNLLSVMTSERDYWNFDEEWFAERLGRWLGFPSDCQLINRGWVEGRAVERLDRVAWNYSGRPEQLMDCHSLRPGFLWSNWMNIRALLSGVLPPEAMHWLDEYRSNFVSLLTPMLEKQNPLSAIQRSELKLS